MQTLVNSRELSGKYQNTGLFHYLLFSFSILIIIQDLVAGNLAAYPLIAKFIKFADEGAPPMLLILIIGSRLLNHRKLFKTNIDKLLLLFMTISILSSVANKVPLGIFLSQAVIYAKGFLMFYIFANISFTPSLINKYIRFFLVIACILLLLGLIDLAFPLQFRTITGNRTDIQYFYNFPSVQAVFDHPAKFGWYMSFITSFCIAYFLIFNRHSYLTAGVIFMLGAFLSMRAKTIIGLVIAILLGLMILPYKKRLYQWILLLVVPAFAILIFWPLILNIFQLKIAVYFTGDYTSEVARNALYLKGLEIAGDFFPFGAGLGRYGSWMSRVVYSPLYDSYHLSGLYGLSREMPHFINDTFWAMVLGESGFLGFIVYAAILFRFLRSLSGEIKIIRDANKRAFLLGTFIMLVEGIIESVAYPTYTSPPTSFFIFSITGIAYSLCRKERE